LSLEEGFEDEFAEERKRINKEIRACEKEIARIRNIYYGKVTPYIQNLVDSLVMRIQSLKKERNGEL